MSISFGLPLMLLLLVQELVRTVRRAIELATGAFCWLDIGGGLSPGRDHIEGMRHGMLHAYLAIVFLSDGYVRSGNCRREIYSALMSSKQVIPVLLPCVDVSSDDWAINEYQNKDKLQQAIYNSGWNAPETREWWKWAEELCSSDPSCRTTPEPEKNNINWSELSKFHPIDLRRSTAFFDEDGRRKLQPLEQVEALSVKVLQELVDRVQKLLVPVDAFSKDQRKAHSEWQKLRGLKKIGLLSRRSGR